MEFSHQCWAESSLLPLHVIQIKHTVSIHCSVHFTAFALPAPLPHSQPACLPRHRPFFLLSAVSQSCGRRPLSVVDVPPLPCPRNPMSWCQCCAPSTQIHPEAESHHRSPERPSQRPLTLGLTVATESDNSVQQEHRLQKDLPAVPRFTP